MIQCHKEFSVSFNFTQLNPDGKIISEVLHGVTQSKGFKTRCLNGENDARVNFSYLAFTILLSLYWSLVEIDGFQ